MPRQIGWSQESNLLYNISMQLDRLAAVTAAAGGGGGGTIAGTIGTGQVAFGSALNTIAGTNNLFWNSSLERLGIGTNTPSQKLVVAGNILSGAIIGVGHATSSVGQIEFFNGNVFIRRTGISGLEFATGSSVVAQTIFSTGNVAIGTNTDGGQRLQVNGTSLFTGNGTFSSYLYAQGYLVSPNIGQDTGWNFNMGGTSVRSGGIFLSNFSFGSGLAPNGNVNGLSIGYNFTGATSTFTNNSILINNTINQTTGNGITRGIYVAPTLTAAFSWRSVETANNTGWAFYAGGTAPSLFNGDVSIAGKLALTVVTNRQTVNYSLVLADNGKLVEMNVGAANTLTVPPNSSIAFPIGTKIDIAQYGAGQTSIVPGLGVTVRSALGALKLAAQYSGASLVKIGTDEWYLFGDITV